VQRREPLLTDIRRRSSEWGALQNRMATRGALATRYIYHRYVQMCFEIFKKYFHFFVLIYSPKQKKQYNCKNNCKDIAFM